MNNMLFGAAVLMMMLIGFVINGWLVLTFGMYSPLHLFGMFVFLLITFSVLYIVNKLLEKSKNE